MKTNRLISLLLALVMLASLVPASVFADSYDISTIGSGSPELFEELFNDFEIPETVADFTPVLHVYADEEHTTELFTFDQIKAGERYYYEVVLRPGEVLTELSVLSKDADNASFVAPCDGVGAFMMFSMNVVMPGDVSIPYDDLYEFVDDQHGYDMIEKDYTPTINARDVTAIMKIIVGNGYDKSGRFEIREENADYNLDGKVNARDVTMVMKRIVGRPDSMAERLAGGAQTIFDVCAETALFCACLPGGADPCDRKTSTMTFDELGALITERLTVFDESIRENVALIWGLYGLTPSVGEDDVDFGFGLFDVFKEYFAFMSSLGMPDPIVVTVDGIDCREGGHPVVRRVIGTSNDAESKQTVVELSDTVIDCSFGEYTSTRLFGDSGFIFSEDTFDGVNSCTLALITLPGLVFDDVETYVTETLKTSEIAANEAIEYHDGRTTVERMTDFSYAMLRDLAIDYDTCEVIDKNVFISPVSVAFALAMAANGADGETRSYFERLFGDIDELNGGLQALWYSLTSDRETKLTLADSVWIRAGLTVLDSYLETLKAYYRGELYADQPFDSTTTSAINAWVSDNTLGLIKKLVDDDNLSSAALLLLNAVGFDGKWASPFDGVSKHEFTSLNGTAATVDMMSGTAERYIDTGFAEGFAKDYENGQYSLVVLVPRDYLDYYSDDPADVVLDENELRAYMLMLTLSDLDSYWFCKSLNEAEFSPITVRMPKFNIEYSLSFKDDIFTDGRLPVPFDPSRADFSGITGDNSLHIEDVIHKAVIEVNEYGTKAAAATAVIFEKNASPAPKEYAVTVDRPFVYMIIENSTNVPVFVGVMTDLGTVVD